MKFRVHTFQTIRVVYEVEAASADDAYKLVHADGWNMDHVERSFEDPEWADGMIVDPLLPNGDIDYDNVVNYAGDELERILEELK